MKGWSRASLSFAWGGVEAEKTLKAGKRGASKRDRGGKKPLSKSNEMVASEDDESRGLSSHRPRHSQNDRSLTADLNGYGNRDI